ELEVLQSVPKVPQLKAPKAESRADLFLPPEQFTKLRDALPEHLRDLVTFAVFTLLRKANVLNLKWENVNLERREVYIEGKDMKAGKRQVVPLAPQAFDALNRQVGKNPIYVWTYGKGGRHLTFIGSKTWKNAVKAAGIDQRISFHSLRHTGASWLAQAGASEAELMQAGSWSNPVVVKRYAKLRPQDKAQTFGRLADIDVK
ncbi:MAG: site-specific integrase, partial [Gammaproteobacteria bacterium]